MSSYFSSILTSTTSRYNSIRRTLLSDETDGDTEDDSHVSRVLRAYYTEKGRQFPSWLPPDPRVPQAAPAQFMSAASRQPQRSSGGRAGGLSDLWDPSPQSDGSLERNSLSLRRGAQGRAATQAAQPNQNRFGASAGVVDSYETGSAGPQNSAQRPLPSQRAGSHQSQHREPMGRSGSSAQERLKARLLSGNRAISPLQSPLPSPSTPPPTSSQQTSYTRSTSYEDPAHPSEGRSEGHTTITNAYVSASSPWAAGENDPYAGGGHGGRGYIASDGTQEPMGSSDEKRLQVPAPGTSRAPRNRYGLPSGPKMR